MLNPCRLFPMKESTPNKFALLNFARGAFLQLAALGLTTVIAFGGTVSPQLSAMNPNQSVQVIVKHHDANLLGAVCGAVNLIDVLPGGELCSMTVANAVSLGNDVRVSHISVNNN